MVNSPNEVRFEEHQYLRQPWLWILIGGFVVFEVALFSHGLYQQLYLGEPWGNNPTSDRTLLITAVLVFAFAVGLLAALLALRLSIFVDTTHLHVRFLPFLRRSIPLDQITRCEARTYRPLREYGGWGVRWGWGGRGWVYSVSGNRGVQLEFVSGKRLLIGSRRPEQLANAITSAMGR